MPTAPIWARDFCLRSGDRRLADGELARPQYAAAGGPRRGTTLDGNFKPTDVQDFYSLGGFFNLSGLAPQSLLGPNYAIARAIYFRKISRGGEGFFEFPVYVGMSLEAGNTWDASRRHQLRIRAQGRIAVPGLRHLSRTGLPGLGLRRKTGNAGYYLFLGRTF